MTERTNVILFKSTGRNQGNHLVCDYANETARTAFWDTAFTKYDFECSIEKTNSLDFVLNIDLSAIEKPGLIDYGCYKDSAKFNDVFFYVTKIEYKNDRFFILHCHVDSFETYFSIPEKRGFSPETRIMREHRNRWTHDGHPVIDDTPETVSCETYLDSFSPLQGNISATMHSLGVMGLFVFYRHMTYDSSLDHYVPDSSGLEKLNFFIDPKYASHNYIYELNGVGIDDAPMIFRSNTMDQTTKVEYLSDFDVLFSSVNISSASGITTVNLIPKIFSGTYLSVEKVLEKTNVNQYELLMNSEKTRSIKLTSQVSVNPFSYDPSMPSNASYARDVLNETKLLSSQFNHKELKLGELTYPLALENENSYFDSGNVFSVSHSMVFNTSEIEELNIGDHFKDLTEKKLITRVNKGVFWTNTGWESWLNDFDNQRNNALISSGINLAGGAISAVAGGKVGAIGVVSSVMNLSKDLSANFLTADAQKDHQRRYASVTESGDPTGFIKESEAPYNMPVLNNYKLKTIYQSMMEEIFYYIGYETNRMYIPNIRSRIDFNFLQASVPYFKNVEFETNEQEEELKSRFADGLEIMHYDSSNLTGKLSDRIDVNFTYLSNFCNYERY